jgi:hypothetical protein
VTRHGYRRGGFFGGYETRREEVELRALKLASMACSFQNAADPTIGSGMQQARDFRAEKTVEVVRNHEDGTCSAVVPTSRRVATLARVDARKHVDGRVTVNPMRGGWFSSQGRATAPKWRRRAMRVRVTG